MVTYYVRTFLPWILLAVVGGYGDQAGAVSGLVAALVLLALDLRHGHRADALVLEISTLTYMAALSVVAFAAPGSVVLDYGASLAIGWLAVTAWGTLLLGRPFTAGIARRTVSAEIAETDLFKRIGRVLTAAWAADFTVVAVALGCVQHWAPENTALLVAVKVAGFAAPAVLSARYPKIARKRHLAAHDRPSAPEPGEAPERTLQPC